MTRKRSGNLFIHLILIAGGVMMLLPFLWMILTSFKTYQESIKMPPVFIPRELFTAARESGNFFAGVFDNYSFLLDNVPYFGNLYFNTFALIAIRIVCAAVFSSMAAYAFARLEFPLKRFFFWIIMIQLMMPSEIFIIPQYRMVVALGLKNTLAALVFPGLVSAFGVFFMRQFYMSLPGELFDAAKLDGCNHWQTFLYVAAPLTRTAVVALSIFTAVFAWQELMWPMIVNSNNEQATLSVGLAKIQNMELVFKPTHFMAAAVLAMIPMVVIYMIFQKQFIEGIALTGTKS